MKTWNYKVVKQSRGHNGEWFSHRAAGTFAGFGEACEFARRLHAQQQAVLGLDHGHKYSVVPRRSGGEEKTFRLSVPADQYVA